MSLKDRFLRWWYFKVRNTVVRKGEKGGFRWVFRRFWLEISTVSDNFRMRFTAAEHPYGYLAAGEGDDNIQGFCETMYMLGHLLTTDQELVDEVQKAIGKYEGRLTKKDVEDENEEAALEEVRQVQEYVDMGKKERRKYERDVNGRFKKAVKSARSLQDDK